MQTVTYTVHNPIIGENVTISGLVDNFVVESYEKDMPPYDTVIIRNIRTNDFSRLIIGSGVWIVQYYAIPHIVTFHGVANNPVFANTLLPRLANVGRLKSILQSPQSPHTSSKKINNKRVEFVEDLEIRSYNPIHSPPRELQIKTEKMVNDPTLMGFGLLNKKYKFQILEKTPKNAKIAFIKEKPLEFDKMNIILIYKNTNGEWKIRGATKKHTTDANYLLQFYQ